MIATLWPVSMQLDIASTIFGTIVVFLRFSCIGFTPFSGSAGGIRSVGSRNIESRQNEVQFGFNLAGGLLRTPVCFYPSNPLGALFPERPVAFRNSFEQASVRFYPVRLTPGGYAFKSYFYIQIKPEGEVGLRESRREDHLSDVLFRNPPSPYLIGKGRVVVSLAQDDFIPLERGENDSFGMLESVGDE